MSPSATVRLFLAAILAVLAGLSSAWAGGGGVLLLTSYHQGDPWTDGEVAGIQEALGPDVELRVEHLDIRRMDSGEQVAEMRRHLARKYAGERLDALAAADDAALSLLLHMRGRELPGLPLVFCGVNNVEPERLQGVAGRKSVV